MCQEQDDFFENPKFIEDLKNHDEEAWKKLVLRLHNPLVRYLELLGRERADAENLVQDTWKKAYKNIAKVQPGGLKAWLYKIAYNEYRNYRRKKKPDTESSLRGHSVEDLENPLQELVVDSGPEPWEQLAEDDWLRNALKELTEEQSLCFVLQFFLDLDYKEIAARVGITVGCVKSRLNSARVRLREIWERD